MLNLLGVRPIELGMSNSINDGATPSPLTAPNGSAWAPSLDTTGKVQPYDVYEAEIFRFALAQAGGCVSRAAEMLHVGRATMYRKMRAYSIIAPPVSERLIDRSRRHGHDHDEPMAQAPDAQHYGHGDQSS